MLKKHRYLPVLLFCLIACQRNENAVFEGATMGTVYQVKIIGKNLDRAALEEGIRERVERVNLLMSNWVIDSDVTRFNYYSGIGPFEVSEHTAIVVKRILELARLTGGALDPTVSPLIELWGFGTQRDVPFPSEEEIRRALQMVGFEKLTLEGNFLRKSFPRLSVNLSALAKGYAVDRVSAYLEEKHITRYMINIGGEVRTSGNNHEGIPWRIGIERPEVNDRNRVYRTVAPGNNAMATSGDYRNYFEYNGIKYSHILDPRTGYPIKPNVTLASVIAPDCMTADGLATALMVLNPEEGVALIEQLQGVECLILVRGEDGTLVEPPYTSSGMAAFFVD